MRNTPSEVPASERTLPRPIRPYLIAVAAVSLAAIVRWSLSPTWGPIALPFITFYPATAVSAVLGGLRGGLSATVLSALIASAAFLPRFGSDGAWTLPDRAALVVFLAVNAVISVLAERLHRTRCDLEASRAAALARQSELETLLDLAPVIIGVGYDRDCRVIDLNRAGAKLLGVSEGQNVSPYGPDFGRLSYELRQDGVAMRPEQFPMVRAARTGETITGAELEVIRRDGARFTVLGAAAPLRDQRGAVRGALGIFIDITDRKRAERDREELLARAEHARDEAESASRAKDAFLATVSHELRTPLSPILAWARMLRLGKLEAHQRERAVEVIERSAKTQAQLVEDLLDVSRIVSGKLRLNVRPVELSAIIEAALETARPAAEAKGITLRSVLDTGVGAVSGDAERLQQVVWNLLSNAVKFTPKGGRVQVVLQRVNSHVEIAVSDTGRGIPPEFAPRLFDRFWQADASTTRHHGGLGLGLAIVRHIVELHGGTVEADSAGADQGATFTVQLPLMPLARKVSDQPRRHPAVADGAAVQAWLRLDGLRVLVVDDEIDSNEVVAALLSSCGAEVRAAISVPAALDVVASWRPDVLVSDVGMPVLDGYAMLDKLRALDGPVADVPIIALTGYANVEDRIRLLAAGFAMHVPKPVEPAELIAAVATVAHRGDHRSRQQGSS